MLPVTCVNSFESIADEWTDLLPTCTVNVLFLTPQWQRVWWKEIGDGIPLCLLRVGGDKNLQGIASLRSDNGSLTFMGDEDLCDYNDFLVPQGLERPFYGALVDHLSQLEWSTLSLYSLPHDSPTLVHLPELARARGYRVDITEGEVSPGIALPGTWDEYLSSLSKKQRHELRRKLRRLESAEGARWYSVNEPDDIEGSMSDFLALLQLSRQDKHRFLTPQRERFFRSIGTELGALGMVKLFFMEIGGERVASALCFDYGSSRMLYNSGYNPEFGYYSPGFLLKALSLKSAVQEGKEYFDFLRGDEAYKYHLGGQDRQLYTMVVSKD